MSGAGAVSARISRVGAFLAVSLLVLAACSTASNSETFHAALAEAARGADGKAPSSAAALAQNPALAQKPEAGVPQPAPARPSPCALLSSSDRSSLGIVSSGKPTSLGGAQACDWRVPNAFGITVTVEKTAGKNPGKSAAGKNFTLFPVGKHQAYKIADRGGSGICAMIFPAAVSSPTTVSSAMQAGETVHIDVSNANFRDSALACKRVLTVAKLVEPKLP